MPIPQPITQSIISTTAWGIPITDEVNRLTTEGVTQGADIDALELALTKLPTRIQVGSATVPASPQPYQVTFPIAFTAQPYIAITGAGSASPTRLFCINNNTTTGVQVYCMNNSGTAVAGFFHWIAIQP